MKPRSTLLLAVFVALAGAALWHFELREGAKPEGDGEATKIFAGLEAKQIDWVELALADGASLRIEKRGEEWRLTKPIDFAADEFAAGAIASGLADLASASVFDPAAEDAAQHPEPLASYGLTREPRVRFSAAGKQHALRIGDPTPGSGSSYVAAEGDARVFVVPQWQTSAFGKTLHELRETRLLDFEREKLVKIVLAWGEGGATLEKKDGAWRVTAPLADAADELALQSLISELQGLRAEAFLDVPLPDDALGFAAPAYRAELALEGGANYALTLGGPREGARIAARTGASGAVEIAASHLDSLPKSVSALRDKQLASFSSEDAQRFALTFTEASGETLEVAGTNSPDGWTSEPAMAPGAASALVADIGSLAAAEIAAESLGDAERAALGLAPAHARFRVFGAGEAAAAPVLADISFGVLRAASGIAAQRADRSTIYWVEETRGAALPQSAAQFRESFAAKTAADAASPQPPAN